MKDRNHRRRKIRLDILSTLSKRITTKNPRKDNSRKNQTAISGTESAIKTDTGKISNGKFISGPLFQNERKIRKEPAVNTTGEINPKN